MGTATFSNNGNYYIDVDAALVSQNRGGNFSTIYWRVDVVKTYGSGFWASTGIGNKGWADSSQGGDRDLWNAGDLAYDFRNGSNTGRWTLAQGQFNVQHRSDGNAEYFVNGGLTLASLGSATAGTGWRSLPRLANVPDAPTPLGIDNVTMTSMTYHFSGNYDGGSPIREWQVGWGADPNSAQWYETGGPINNGVATVAVPPATTFYFWSRGRNDVGWGPWSNRISAQSRAGVRVKINGVWRTAVPYAKINGVWRMAEPLVKINGTWKKCG